MPDYHYLKPHPIGHQVIALDEFGGTAVDPVGAALRVDGWRRVSIVCPRPALADRERHKRFREAVRDLAQEYDFASRRRHGPVDIVWNPAEGKSERYEEPGEPVDRVV